MFLPIETNGRDLPEDAAEIEHQTSLHSVDRGDFLHSAARMRYGREELGKQMELAERPGNASNNPFLVADLGAESQGIDGTLNR
jgi:hypothetical protein